eukprot:gene9619-1730_t
MELAHIRPQATQEEVLFYYEQELFRKKKFDWNRCMSRGTTHDEQAKEKCKENCEEQRVEQVKPSKIDAASVQAPFTFTTGGGSTLAASAPAAPPSAVMQLFGSGEAPQSDAPFTLTTGGGSTLAASAP